MKYQAPYIHVGMRVVCQALVTKCKLMIFLFIIGKCPFVLSMLSEWSTRCKHTHINLYAHIYIEQRPFANSQYK